jgi:nitroimidazol reductase NimA-like FMN-containing flavoprotein (pyridoxamine 5'-phosphate oxidase superfamily)
MENSEKIFDLLNEIPYGTLSFIKDKQPHQLPVNFVYFNCAIHFHGSKHNKHYAAIKSNPSVSFCAFIPYSYIPSYVSSPSSCSATQFFESFIISGEAKLVENSNDKMEILTAMLNKLQPEGNYENLDTKDYNKMLNSTAVFSIIPKQIQIKFKLGQSYSSDRYEKIVNYLSEKQDNLSIKTLRKMKEYRQKDC